MVQRTGGNRRKTRSMLKKGYKQRGKISLTKYFQTFKEGEKVLLKAEPAVQGGLYHHRFHSRPGVVTGKQGRCYTVQISDLGKAKTVIVHPVHLTKR